MDSLVFNPQFKYLNVYIPENTDLFKSGDEYSSFFQSYKKHIDDHNNKIKSSIYKDAGFDLLMPSGKTLLYSPDNATFMMDLGIQCSMYKVDSLDNTRLIPCSYFLYPRSSTGSKTPLRLANSVGIIDSGYRGNIKACVDFHSCFGDEFQYSREQRLFQICASDLAPLLINLVDAQHSLNIDNGNDTERGCGGFGSTGRV
jgi:dUTP pyrophosphatase